MVLIIAYVCIFIAALILFETLFRAALDQREKSTYTNERMRLLSKEDDSEVVYRDILRKRGLNYNFLGFLSETMTDKITQSGLNVGEFRFLLKIFSLFLVIFSILSYLGFIWYFALLIDVIATPVLIFMIVLWLRGRRIRKFLEQLPDALDIIVRSIAAGHPIHTSVSLVAREMPDPVGSEFGIMNDELTYGIDIDGATKSMVKRVGAEELNFLSITLSVQRSSGGNLTEILSNLSGMLRKRSLLRQKVKAISVEGRMTSWFMLAYPFFLYGLIFALSPTYFDPLWESGYGNIALSVGFTMMLIGMLILKKIVNFDY